MLARGTVGSDLRAPPPPSLMSVTDPWWSFSLEPAADARLTDAAGRPLVNPPDAEGRLGLRYDSYLALDRLLDAQTPASAVPDERVFIVIHQLFELVFKQMTFDLGVLAGTFEALLGKDGDAFDALARESLPDERGPSPFWRPAMTASARLRHSARRVLPAVMTYVGHGEDDDVLFSTVEYQRFRDFLAPASGFQTAQLRLIQRALGKSPLLDVRVYPGGAYGHHYAGCPTGHVALGDPLILGEGRARAFPPEGTPAHAVAELDDRAHAVLTRLAGTGDGLPDPPSVQMIHPEDVERAVAHVRATPGEEDHAGAVADAFRADLAGAAARENDRRAAFADARRGAQALHACHGGTALAFVLDRLAATDAALHAPDPDSVLTVHRKAVSRHVSG